MRTEAALIFLCFGAGLAGQPTPSEHAPSYLYQPAFAMDHILREPRVPYCPQPGDIFLCTGCEMWAKLGHWAAWSGAPQHSGIVFARPDGQMALLEAGPHNCLHCKTLDLISELTSYAECERVWIRRRMIPLSCEQSVRLTEFALSHEGVRFALLRMLGQLTPFRARGPLRTRFVGGPHGNRCSYFCSELVMEACVAAGLLDPTTTRPCATYPRDLFFGRSRNPFLNEHLDLSNWAPPARWTPWPDAEPPSIRPFPFLDGDDKSR
jgi:hypothetical protein